MAKLSIVLPSRDEKFLIPTIHDIFRNARGEFEVIAVLDSDKWPDNWKSVTDQHPNLHTIFHGTPRGMRAAINSGVGSAISRGAKFIAKFDAHCSFSEGFDEVLKAECDKDWIVVPRRGRLDPENWCETELQKPPIDYHYLSFPDDPNDFGGPGLNGKVWAERAVERKDILLDDEMSSQGSGWFMHAEFFQRMGFMDETSYGPFWNEFQELGMCAWLSGGAVKVNKKCKYLHLHKGSKHGRGYHLPERWLTQGRNHTMLWPWNEAWDQRQTRPFKWLIDHFWPVPTWPENWEEVLYAQRKPRLVSVDDLVGVVGIGNDNGQPPSSLNIYSAYYGIGPYVGQCVDVTERLRSLVKASSLDIIVNNSTLTPDQNPFRGKKKHLVVVYSIDKGEDVKRRVEEKDWLIIGPNTKFVGGVQNPIPETELGLADKYCPRCGRKLRLHPNETFPTHAKTIEEELREVNPTICSGSGKQYEKVVVVHEKQLPMAAAALNDYLIRRFQISPQRLRGPMPIELRDFHRNDLAQLFAELGFKRGAEIGVAEGNYSEVLLKANPECELLLVDPWHHYNDNPQGKSKEKHEFAFNETARKIAPYRNAKVYTEYSMDAVKNVVEESLDFCYIDANHLFDHCVQDLVEWSRRVRSGGIISGDDYYALDQKRWVGGGVVEAVQAYVNAHQIPVWWIFQGHKSVDFMWCKP